MKVLRQGAALSIAVAGLTVLGAASPAYAATAQGPDAYYGPIYGYSYYNYNWIDSSIEEAVTIVGNQEAANVPTGYMGDQAELWTSSGSLCLASGWYYNPSPAGSISYGVSGTCGAGNYYSQGVTSAYDGNGYVSYQSDQSPDVYFAS